MSVEQTKDFLQALSQEISLGEIGQATLWEGGGVVIACLPLDRAQEGFYPAPLTVVTEYCHEVSWLFDSVKRAFMSLDDYWNWKDTLFKRLGHAANAYLVVHDQPSSKGLLLAVVAEASAVAGEIERGEFQEPPVV